MNFQSSFEKLIGHEGGLVNDPLDPGGQTRYGISKRAYPGEDIAGMTLDRAQVLYQRDYWGPAGCDAVPDGIKFDLFDMSVNSGVRAAVKTVQRAVGETPDGMLGPRTLQAIGSMPAGRLVARFNGYRILYVTSQPDVWWQRFGRGLMNRIGANLKDA